MRGEQSWPRALSRAGTQTEGAGLPAWTREANRGLLSQQTRMTIVILFSCQVFALSACLWGNSPRCGDSVNCPPREPWQWAVRVGGVSSGTSQNRTEQNVGTKPSSRGGDGVHTQTCRREGGSGQRQPGPRVRMSALKRALFFSYCCLRKEQSAQTICPKSDYTHRS